MSGAFTDYRKWWVYQVNRKWQISSPAPGSVFHLFDSFEEAIKAYNEGTRK